MEITNLVKIPATGKLDNSFVGIKISNNQIEFHYPETFKLSDNYADLRKNIMQVLRTVSLAKTRTSDMSSYNTSHNNANVFPLGAYLWIINDYLTYGRYENREKVYERGTHGKINWKKTMHSNPIISEGNVIYSDIISEKKTQKDNLLTEIYNFCVKRAVDSIGWLYGIGFDTNGVDYYRLFKTKKTLYLNNINTEASHTFDDQKKTRLNNMRNIIVGLDDDMINTRDIIYGVDSYDYVFERMIDSMFSNVKNIKEFYPSATWDLRFENGPKKSSNLRPDTVLIKDNKVYILDAKYYRYGTTFYSGDMPETTSIQKQITYGEYVKKVKANEYDDVFSAFILPYSKYDNKHKKALNGNIEFVGVGEANWIKGEKLEKSQRIVALLIDTTFLIQNWLKKNEDCIDETIELIEKNVGGIEREQYW